MGIRVDVYISGWCQCYVREWHYAIGTFGDICAVDWNDGIELFDETIIHSAAMATVRFYSSLDEDANNGILLN